MTAAIQHLVKPVPIPHDASLVRPLVCGEEQGPVSPYPIYLQGWVERGFGRGSKDLGCPTANLPESSIAPYAATLATGVHFGYARVIRSKFPASAGKESAALATADVESEGHDGVYPMVMSIGWNPVYDNATRTAEVHILHPYPHDFYGQEVRVVMLGYVRPEYNYPSFDALIKDIEMDKTVSLASALRPAYAKFVDDPFFTVPSVLDPALREVGGGKGAVEKKVEETHL